MAKYDRRILIPYLQNVYCIELAIRHQEFALAEFGRALGQLEDKIAEDVPPAEMKAPSAGGVIALGCISLALCSVCATLCVLAVHQSRLWAAAIAVLVPALTFLVFFLRRIKIYNHSNRQYRILRKRRRAYDAREPQRQRMMKKLRQSRERLSASHATLEQAMALRRSLYELDVIPLQFRTLCATEYLHEYFRSSKADDIDIVLQSYIVSHLCATTTEPDSRKVRQLLNNRIHTARRVTEDAVYCCNRQTLMNQIINRETNPDLKEQYTRMVQADLQLSDYFAQLPLLRETDSVE